MNRRMFLGASAVLLPACSSGGDGDMGFPLAPWHMWGNTLVLRETIASAGDAEVSSGQLLKISYGRPETWSFFFGARLLGGTPVGMVVRLSVDLILGVGRSSFDTRGVQPIPPGQVLTGFCVFAWNLAPGQNPSQAPNNVRFSNTGRAVVRDANSDGPGSPALVQDVSWVAAEEIQARATMSVAAAGSGSIEAEISAYFAPRSHVRPEWFQEEFRGNENRGT